MVMKSIRENRRPIFADNEDSACLRPDYTTINMPKSVFERFNSKKGGIYDDLLSGVEIVHGGYRVPASKA